MATVPGTPTARGYRVRGATLEHHRLCKGWSRAQLAAKAEVSPTQIWRVERTNHLPRASTLKRITDALGIDVAAVLAPAGDDDDGEESAA